MTKKRERNEELVADEATARAATGAAQAGDQPTGATQAEDEQPPFGGSWGVLYAAVLFNLIFLIVLFYIFTKAFA